MEEMEICKKIIIIVTRERGGRKPKFTAQRKIFSRLFKIAPPSNQNPKGG